MSNSIIASLDVAKGDDRRCTGATLTYKTDTDGHVEITLGPRIHFEYEAAKVQAEAVDKDPDTGCKERSETSGGTSEITEHGSSSARKPGHEERIHPH